MKFSAAALALLVTAPAAAAFSLHPQTAFGVELRRRGSHNVKQNQGHPIHHVLRSTTEDDLIASTIKNSMSPSDLQEIIQQKQQPRKAAIKKKASSRQPLSPEQEEELGRVSAVETRATAAAYLSQFQGQSGAAAVYSKLVENGVSCVNGFSGGAVLPLLDQFHVEHPRHDETDAADPIRWITNSNESSAGHIAEGYAKSMDINGKHKPVGVVVATSGPGVTNLITPLQDALCDGVPLVFLCGQAASVAPPDSFQSADAVGLTTPCTKWSYQIKSAAEIPMVMDYAFYVARNGRPGPVFVDLPKDLQNQIITPELINDFVEKTLADDVPADVENPSFAKLVKRRRPDGSVFSPLFFGKKDQGLAFEVSKSKQGHTFHVEPVPVAEDSDDFHADHAPTNRIYNAGTFVNGVENKQVESFSVDSALTKEMVARIKHAKKPVILAGQGCNDCPDELREFAETLQIPVCTTLHALGCFDERHPLALNMLGMHGHPTPNFMIQESDLIICIGSRFDDRITGRQSDFAPEAQQAQTEGRGGVIHVDIRLTEKAKQIPPTFFVHSTGKRFLHTMNEVLKSSEKAHKPITGAWLKEMRRLQKEFPVKIPHFDTQEVTVTDENGEEKTVPRTPMSAQSVITTLNELLLEADKMDDCIFTTGVGIHQMVAAQLITWTQPRQMLSSGSLGTMGVALGYAIGAQLANGKKIVIAVDGDGSFNMTFTELKTVAEQGIPIKIMILDNNGQMMVEYWQRLFHDNRLIAVRNSQNPDYSTLAKAFGIKSVYCDAQEDLAEKMNEFLFADPGEPVLFHVCVERTPCLPLVAPGQPLGDMILEDVEVDVDGAAAPS